MQKTYQTPENMRIYAIGDIHGYVDLLDRMHEAIMFDLVDGAPEHVHVVYLGDYIDRGPDSAAVIDRLIERRDRGDGVPKTFIMGNHEMALFEFMHDPEGHNWLNYGGVQTLASYGITFENDTILPSEYVLAAEKMRRQIPAEHLEFMMGCEFSLVLGDYLFAHAGINPMKSIDDQTKSELTFIREPFLSWDRDPAFKPLSHKIVHGHTPSEAPENLPHRIGVDTGAYESGVLSCAVLEEADVRFLSVGDKTP